MAQIDLLIAGKNCQKKSVSLSTAEMDFGEIGGEIADTILLFNLPARAVVTNAYFLVKEGVAGATATGKISVGGIDVIAAVAFAGVADAIKGGAVTKVHTGTGAEVLVTIGVAAVTAGVVEAVVEYDEYTKASGELTTV